MPEVTAWALLVLLGPGHGRGGLPRVRDWVQAVLQQKEPHKQVLGPLTSPTRPTLLTSPPRPALTRNGTCVLLAQRGALWRRPNDPAWRARSGWLRHQLAR